MTRREDMILTGIRPNVPMAYESRSRTVRIPSDLIPARTQKLDAAALGSLLDSYHRDNPDAPQFSVRETRYGLHIIPTLLRGDEGQVVRAVTPLDAIVTVPVGDRMASGHLAALSAAVNAAAGIKTLLIDDSVDSYYAANGLALPRRVLARLLTGSGGEEAKRPYVFRWGASGVPAREALLSLLEGSASTLTWYVTCHPSPDPANRLCNFSVVPLTVVVVGPDGKASKRSLAYDRCTKCPPLGPPPPVSPPK